MILPFLIQDLCTTPCPLHGRPFLMFLVPMAGIQSLIVALQGLRYLLILIFYCPFSILLLCSHHQYRLLQVEDHGVYEELHVPLLETGIAHPGKAVSSFQGTNTLFNPIVYVDDESAAGYKVRGLPRA